ncbi:MAG: outer membrane beta-barrel family protein, partial [Muribaculaceae bacterium]|nr:outer membrane beta-barrel family protein [Muribaculaceae bacterium]
KNFSVSNFLSGIFIRSVDLLGVSDRMTLNTVHNNQLNDRFQFSWQIPKYRINAFVQVAYSHFTGAEANFVPFSTTEFSYGMTGVLQLPANFGLSTDFTIYSRRGYADAALNTDNYVWNGRLTYSMLKGKLIASIDAYDILHNLSNVFYSVNAQGRTETFRTVLPRYVMLTLQWRFNSSDNKKK